MQTGRLILAGAPLGNPDDASPRLRAALQEATVIAAEDTRRLRRLASTLDVVLSARIVSYFDGNEAQRAGELLDELRNGVDLLLITDAGMPSVSDPGYRLVAAAAAEGIAVTSLPGPSAVTTALAVSGLPCERFCFEGFLPRREGKRRTALQELSGQTRTIVFFEAPHRLAECLRAAAEVLGADRQAAVCRELTKTFEEVRRGTLAELAQWATGDVRGEITVVVAGASAAVTADPEQLAAAVRHRVETGMSRRDAIAAVAEDTGVPRNLVYEAATRR